MNPLAQYPAARRVVYTVLWVAGLVLTVMQVWVKVLDYVQPGWLTGALAVFPLVAAYVGYQAQQNTPASSPPVDVASRLDGHVPPEG